jgi:hypothetical protein
LGVLGVSDKTNPLMATKLARHEPSRPLSRWRVTVTAIYEVLTGPGTMAVRVVAHLLACGSDDWGC